jgi:hypothetical protein
MKYEKMNEGMLKEVKQFVKEKDVDDISESKISSAISRSLCCECLVKKLL